jgi:hypothetical protein
MRALTRRRDHNVPHWRIYYDNVQVGAVAASRRLLPQLTDADFDEHRQHRAIYA